MAFDLSTAKPVSTGFDINTARPVDAPPEVIYREETDTAISAPAGLRGNEFEYLDNVQNRGKKTTDHFGFVDVGNSALSALEYPSAFFKGLANAAISANKNLSAGYIRQIAEGKKEVFEDKPLSEMSNAEKLDKIRRDNTPALATFLFGSERDKQLQTGWLQRLVTPKEKGLAKAEGLRQKSIQIQDDTDRFLKRANLTRPDGAAGFVFDVGAIGTTIGASIGLSVATKNPLAAAALFRDMQKNSVYLEAQEKGWDNLEADKVSEYAANFEGALEFVGVNYFLKAAEMSKPLSRIGFRMFEEAIQEGTQTGAEEAITQISSLRDFDIEGAGKKVFYSMLLGALGGGGTAAVMEIGDHVGKQEGVPKVVTDKLAEKIETNMPEIEAHLESLIGEQASPLRADEESAGKVAKMMQDFNDGKEIDVTGLSEDEQGRLREMGLVPKDQIKVDHSLHLPEDFRNFSITYPSTMQGAEDSARDYVRQGQEKTGNEHMLAFDKNGTAIGMAVGTNDRVVIPGDVLHQMNIPGSDMELVHSHPIPIGTGPLDIVAMARDGVKSNVAVGPSGHTARVSFTPEARSSLSKIPLYDRRKTLDDLTHAVWEAARDETKKFMGEENNLQRRQVHNYIFNKALEKAGLTNYEYSTDHFDIASEEMTQKAIDDTVKIIKEGMDIYGIQGATETAKNMAPPVDRGRGEERDATLLPTDANGMGGKGGKPPPDGGGIAEDGDPERDTEADYEAVANQTQGSTLIEDAGDVLKDARHLAADAFVPVSSRAGRINQELKHAIRKFVFNTGLYTTQDQATIKPFITKVSNSFDERDYRIFDLALKNRDLKKIDELVAKYGIEKDWKSVRSVLDDLYTEAKDVGLDMSYIPDYFPRKVQRDRVSEYMAWIRGQEEWSDIQLAMDKADPAKSFTPDEQAEFVNNYLRGFSSNKLNLSKLGMTKKRSVDYVTPEANEFYQDSMPTLIEYISGVRHAIEARRLFGFSEKDTDINIGKYVLSLVEEGSITRDQEKEVATILKAVVEPTGTRGAVTWAKNASYIYLMGSPISAVTQIQDLAFSMYRNGYYQTTRSLLRSLTGNAIVNKEDIGIENVLQEFEGNSRTSEAVKGVFRAVGLSWMDNIGKETLMDAAYSNLRKAAKGDNQKFNDMIYAVFGDEAAQTKQDLIDGNVSENVKYLLFSELSDFQPISLAEMPVGYLRGGNGRIFYMLKTYTVKQIDIYRREIFDEIGSGDPIRAVSGLRNLTKLAFAMMLMGMGSDALKDLLLGREIETDDLVTDNIMKLFGFTKYQIYKARDEGIANAFWKTLFVPPVGAPVDDLYKDISKIGFGDKELKDSEIAGKVPLIGKFYYWWYGGGRTKLDDAEGDAGKF